MTSWTSILLLTLAGTFDDPPAAAQKLYSASGQFFDAFGGAVDMDGGRIVVGGPNGERAWVFDLGENLWTEEAMLVGPDVLNGDAFGFSVGVSGDTVVVGSHRHDGPGGEQSGAGYVFVKEGGNWNLQQKLTGSQALAFNWVGLDAAISGDRILLATSTPSAYAYERTGSVWTEVQVLTLTDGGDAQSVAIEGGRAVIGSAGATFSGFSSGAAYVYGHDSVSWNLEDILLPSTMNPTSSMGTVVKLSGDTVLATAWAENEPGVSQGAAYVFCKGPSGWVEEARLISPQGEDDDNFGWSADIEGDRVAISERTSNPKADPNTCYVFERTASAWKLNASLTPGPQCGCSSPPALADPWLVIGTAAADGVVPGAGAAFVYLFPEDPQTYCTPKVNSQGCSPQIAWSGDPTVAGPDDFVVSAAQVLPKKNGVFFFGTAGQAATPFLGGTLCATPPLQRSPIQQATSGAGCAASIAYPFSQADMATYGLDPGEHVWGQFWMRDPAQLDGTGTSLSDAIEIQFQP